MKRFFDYFGKSHVVLPVIHLDTYENGLDNVKLAKECGADGVFLISHGSITDQELLRFHAEYMRLLGWNRIGVNCLSLGLRDVIDAIEPGGLGIWTDNAGADDLYGRAKCQLLYQAIQDRNLGLYFGGVAFKYQKPVHDFAEASKNAESIMDVITTSGKGTGYAADLQKIKTMSEATDTPIGIASGITPDNIGDYLPYSNAYLVATGISKDFTHLDGDLLSALVNEISQSR